MKNSALLDEEAAVIRDACARWAEFAIEAHLNTRDKPPQLAEVLVFTRDPAAALREAKQEDKRDLFLGYSYLFVQAEAVGTIGRREAGRRIAKLGEIISELLSSPDDQTLMGAAREVARHPILSDASDLCWSILVGSVLRAAYARRVWLPISR